MSDVGEFALVFRALNRASVTDATARVRRFADGRNSKMNS